MRCEKAGAYLRAHGVEDVSQLDEGIHGYLTEMGEEGVYEGRMTVFDGRGAMEGGRGVVGRCVGCGQPTDRHWEERRCRRCRCLVLTCDGCAEEGVSEGILCEEHLVMEGDEVQVRKVLGRLSREELEAMVAVVRRCEDWVEEVRKDHPKRHRNRSRQLQKQRERLEREVAERKRAVIDGDEEERVRGTTLQVWKEKQQRVTLPGDSAEVLLPYMPLLNSI